MGLVTGNWLDNQRLSEFCRQRGRQNLRRAIQAGDFEKAETIRRIFQPLENLRNGINPIRVLHEAVTLAGIGDMGPLLPLLSNLEEEHHSKVQQAAKELLEQNN